MKVLPVIVVVIIIAPVVCAGCAGEEKASADQASADSRRGATEVPDRTHTPAAREPTAASTSTEPAGVVFRGYLVIEREGQLFQACGAAERSWIVDLTGQELADVYASLAINPGDAIFVEFQGLLQPPPDVGFGADYANQIKVLELRRAALEGPGCDEDLSLIEFRARGNEPFWGVDVLRSGIVFSDFGRPVKHVFPYAKPRVSDGQWRYVSAIAGDEEHRIAIDIERRRCNDTMSGAYFSLAAEVEVDGRVYLGCAVQGMEKTE